MRWKWPLRWALTSPEFHDLLLHGYHLKFQLSNKLMSLHNSSSISSLSLSFDWCFDNSLLFASEFSFKHFDTLLVFSNLTFLKHIHVHLVHLVDKILSIKSRSILAFLRHCQMGSLLTEDCIKRIIIFFILMLVMVASPKTFVFDALKLELLQNIAHFSRVLLLSRTSIGRLAWGIVINFRIRMSICDVYFGEVRGGIEFWKYNRSKIWVGSLA